jgi:hypothetical protein
MDTGQFPSGCSPEFLLPRMISFCKLSSEPLSYGAKLRRFEVGSIVPIAADRRSKLKNPASAAVRREREEEWH